MCVNKLQDVKPTVENRVTLGTSTAGVRILTENSRRRAIIFSSNSAAILYYQFRRSAADTTNVGIVMPINAPPFTLTFDQIGSAIFEEVWAAAAAGTPTAFASEYTEG